jgi:hypoxanthine phosphoribosyltransferase
VTQLKILFTEHEIAARVDTLAREITNAAINPGVVVPVLSGAFVFAADLVRALARLGHSIPVEFLWLRSYGDQRTGKEVRTLVGPTEAVRGKTVLLVDGVLDRGSTMVKAKQLLLDAGATGVVIAVAVDKTRDDAVAKADYAAFSGVSGFIIGYGMDDAGKDRALPYIGEVKG